MPQALWRCWRIVVIFHDLTGQLFGQLTVVRRSAFRTANGNVHWECSCDCGQTAIVASSSLRRGLTKSCGCLHRTNAVARATTHGQSKYGAEYRSWKAIIQRCTNPNNIGYRNYGGRGIAICDRWRKSFQNFFADMGPKPTSRHSIDRIDNNGSYEPGNCRWITRREQTRNTRANRVLEYQGRNLCLSALAQEAGMSAATLWRRLKLGWDIDKAMTTPVGQRHFEEHGE